MSNGRLEFYQIDLYKYANDKDNEGFFSKITKEYGVNYYQTPGYCYGITHEYLISSMFNQGDKYLHQLNYLYDVIHIRVNGLSEIDNIKQDALRMHAKSLLNEYIYDILKWQSNYENSIRNYNYFINIKAKDYESKNFIDCIKEVLKINYIEKGMGGDNVYYGYLYQLQLILANKYLKALFASPSYFRTREGKAISQDPLFRSLQSRYKNKLDRLNKNFTEQDVIYFIHTVSDKIQRDNYLKIYNMKNRKGTYIDNTHNSYNYTQHLPINSSINKLKKTLRMHVESSKESLYYKVSSLRHAMAITVCYDENELKWVYKFFDPNGGEVSFSQIDKFISFIDGFVKRNAEKYFFRELGNGDYEVDLYKIVPNGNKDIVYNIKYLNKTDMLITENVLLVERKITYRGSHFKIKYEYFDIDNKIIKLKIKYHQKTKIVYTDILDNQKLHSIIDNNVNEIYKTKKDVFVSKNDFKFYILGEKFDVNNIQSIIEMSTKEMKGIALEGLTKNSILDTDNVIKNDNKVLPENQTVRGINVLLNKEQLHSMRSLLESIALGDTNTESIDIGKYTYLKEFFGDSTGNLDIQKFNSAIYDPLLSPKINHYLNEYFSSNLNYWNNLFNVDVDLTLQQQAIDTLTLLRAIHNDPTILNKLSKRSNLLLEMLFPAINGFDRAEVLRLVNHTNAFLLMENTLNGVANLSKDVDKTLPKSLSFSDIVNKYHSAQTKRHLQFNILVNQMGYYPSELQLNILNHTWLREGDSYSEMDKKIGFTYSLGFTNEGENVTNEVFEKIKILENKKEINVISDNENELLTKIKFYFNSLEKLFKESEGEVINISLKNVLSKTNEKNVIFIKGNLSFFTIKYKVQGNNHIYTLIDQDGMQLSIINQSDDSARESFCQLLINYFNEDISNDKGEKKKRGIYAGFSLNNSNNFMVNIQRIDLNNENASSIMKGYTEYRDNIVNHTDLIGCDNKWVYFGNSKISFAKLKKLDATINNKKITFSDLKQKDWVKKVRFDAEKLVTELTMLNKSEENFALLKILQQQLTELNFVDIIQYKTKFHNSALLEKQLKYIEKNIAIINTQYMPELIENLQKIGMELPYFKRLSNRFGQVMGGVGGIQTLINIHTLLDLLDNPDLTEEEGRELEKQLYITCGAAFFNYGDMILQPILLNISGRMGSSSVALARISAGIVVIFNLVGMGIDAYQAYENLAKLENIANTKQRQDLIVNAAFSIASFVVNGVTVIGVLVGPSTVPIAGLVIGGLLLVGGWVYNGVSAVNRIKSEIDISWDRELEEGIRGAFGMQPTIRTQQEITVKRYIEFYKKSDWQIAVENFENTLMEIGFDHHLSIIENPLYKKQHHYYLVDEKGNYFGGKLKTLYLGRRASIQHYTEQGAPSFSEEEADSLLNNYDLQNSGTAVLRKTNRTIKYKKVKKEVFHLARTGSTATHEFYYFNSDYKDPLLEKFKIKHGIKNEYKVKPTENQIATSHSEQIRFFSKKTKFGVLGQTINNENHQRHSETLVNDIPRISLYLDDSENMGSSFHTASGNDVIIGYKNRMNAFQILSGNKYFSGGDFKDFFYLNDSEFNSLVSKDSQPTKFLDGLSGQDVLIINERPLNYSVQVKLKDNSVHYVNNNKDSSIFIAHVKNIENIMVMNNSNDKIFGDNENNILDGGLGEDVLYGYSGDDTLILTQGHANGGYGNDIYQIRRFLWYQHVNDLYSISKIYNDKTKQFDVENTLNADYLENNYKFNADVIIDESSQSLSIIRLDYSLDEIKDVYVNGLHLYFKIKLSIDKIDDNDFSKIDSQVTVELKNIYRATKDGRKLNHKYQVITRDGFVLESQLSNRNHGINKKVKEKIFTITYFQYLDQLIISKQNKVYIDGDEKAIIVGNNRLYQSTNWGDLKWTGLAENLTYEGSRDNDVLTEVSAGNNIKVSLGKDIYRLEKIKNGQEDIVFDFSTVRAIYTHEDKVVLLLPTVNGFQLRMESNRLCVKDRFGDVLFSIRFEEFNRSMHDAVIIQDKYSNIFTIDLNDQGGTINSVFSMGKYHSENKIILPEGDVLKNEVISGNNSDSVILDNSHASQIIISGNGDDTVTSLYGNNVLYGGKGSNFIKGGKGQDLLLSAQGFDTLMGEKGNDHYLIDGTTAGAAYIDDGEGENHIHLISFQPEMTHDIQDDGTEYHYYLSKAGKIVKIKQYKSSKYPTYQIHFYEQPSDHLQTMLTDGMEKLINYLAKQRWQAYLAGLQESWVPVHELNHDLKGVTEQLKVTLSNDGIILSDESERINWLVDAKAGDDQILDMSGHGRVLKGGLGNDKLIVFAGNNILYGGKGDDILHAGVGEDILISLTGKDQLAGGPGADLYIIDGLGEGDVTIRDLEGRNKIILVNFGDSLVKEEVISVKEMHSVYQSKSGRVVNIYHNNHLINMGDMTEFHLASNESLLAQQPEQTVDRLLQLLVEQRHEDEYNFDEASSTAQNNYWKPILYTERFLTHF